MVLDKIADLFISFCISDFDSFWNHLLVIFGSFEEIPLLNPEFEKLYSKLLRAAILKGGSDLIENIASSIAMNYVGFDVDAFFQKNDCSEEIRNLILSKWL